MSVDQCVLPSRIALRIRRFVKGNRAFTAKSIITSAIEEYLNELEEDVTLRVELQKGGKLTRLIHELDEACKKVDVKKIPSMRQQLKNQ